VGPVGGAGGQKSVKVVTFWLVLNRHFCAGTEGQTQPVNQAWSLGYTSSPLLLLSRGSQKVGNTFLPKIKIAFVWNSDATLTLCLSQSDQSKDLFANHYSSSSTVVLVGFEPYNTTTFCVILSTIFPITYTYIGTFIGRNSSFGYSCSVRH